MRIAIFAETFLPKWDGVAHTLCRLLEHLRARGHEGLMFAPLGAPPAYADTPIVGLPCFPLPFYPELRLVRPGADLGARLAAFRPDVVHVANPAILGLLGLRKARELGAPVVASYHTDIPGYTQYYGVGWMIEPLWAYFRWLHNQADLNLAPSRFTREQLRARGFERLGIWARGVDAERFHPRHRDRAWRARLGGGDGNGPLLLYVGRLATEKRVEWLRPLLAALPGARLAIVGAGPLRNELAEEFAGTPTTFLGYLTGHDLACAYAAADLFVFPSASETFGNVVLEAMASGLPVIAPDAGGQVDHVRDGRNGYLFSAGSRAHLVTQVLQVARNPGLRRRLAAGARAYAETRTWTANLDGLLSEYEALACGAGSLARAG
jgi:glycosyltransferase involved in cell wall biosynthesis